MAHGLDQEQAFYTGLGAMLAAKRQLLASRLGAMGFQVLPAQGTYFLVADFAGLVPEGSAEDDVEVHVCMCVGWSDLFCLVVPACGLRLVCRGAGAHSHSAPAARLTPAHTVLLPLDARGGRDPHPSQRILRGQVRVRACVRAHVRACAEGEAGCTNRHVGRESGCAPAAFTAPLHHPLL